jgi:hypothetical protein
MHHVTKKTGIKIALLFVFFMSSVLYSAVLLEAGIGTGKVIRFGS